MNEIRIQPGLDILHHYHNKTLGDVDKYYTGEIINIESRRFVH